MEKELVFLKKENHSLKNEVDSLKQENDFLKRENEAFEEMDIFSQKECLSNEMDILRKENEFLKNENLGLKSKPVALSLKIAEPEKKEDLVAISLKNENAFLKRKVSYLKRDLSRFVKGKRKLDALLGNQRSCLDKGGVGYIHGKHDINHKTLFVKATQICKPLLQNNFRTNHEHKSQSYSYSHYVHGRMSKEQHPKKQANPKGPKMIWVPKIR